MAEGRKVRIETYNPQEWNEGSRKRVSESFHEFGIEQNRYNKIVVNRLRKVEAENRELNLQLQEQSDYFVMQLKEYEDMIKELYGRMDEMKKELDRLKLTAKLNSNSIDRIIKKMPGAIDLDIEID